VVPTPLQRWDRLGSALGFAPGVLLAKRDDLTGLVGGGNKARKLDHLIAAALSAGADTLVTGGAAQSNHVRMTAAAAAVNGLRCVAVLGGREPEVVEGNLVLDHLLGAELVWVDDDDLEAVQAAIVAEGERLRGEGRRPHTIPLGGATSTGSLGYVDCADELSPLLPAGTRIYTATGTGGTQAGLAAGLGSHVPIVGVDVGAVRGVQEIVGSLAESTARLAGRPDPTGDPVLDTSQVGDGYGAHTDAAREAIGLLARHEGVLVDPVYSAKALAGLIADRRSGRLDPEAPTVFLHTGGFPSLFQADTVSWLLA